MRAFTLIETLVYLSLFSLVISGSIGSLMGIRSNTSRIEASARLTDEASFVLERLRYVIERAETVSLVKPSHLGLATESETISFYTSAGTFIQETNGLALPLTEPTTVIRDLFINLNPGHGIVVSFEIKVPLSDGGFLARKFSETLHPVNAL